MINILRRIALRSLVGFVSLLTLPFAAYADGDWRFDAAINLWLPSISGKTSFPIAGAPSIGLSAEDVIDALKMTFMGSFDVKKGPWGLFTDVTYVDLGDSKSGSRKFSLGNIGLPAGLDANLDLDVKSWIWTTVGTYSTIASPHATFDLMAGARLLDMKQTLTYQMNGTVGSGITLPPRAGVIEVGGSNWDAVFGFRGRANFGAQNKWFIPYYLDFGAGESKSTWHAILGMGYQLQWGTMTATWRHIDYEFNSGSPLQTLMIDGPAISASLHW